MKRTLTGIAAAAMVLGTMAPAAFAATTAPAFTSGGGKSITLDGTTLYNGVQVGNAKDAGTVTSYFPIYYLQQTLTKAGYTHTYNVSTHTWDITIPGVTASSLNIAGGVGTGNAAISINGTVVKKFNAQFQKDLAGGKNAVVTTYFPIYYLSNVLTAAGFGTSWTGSSFGFTQSKLAISSAVATGAKKVSVTFSKPVTNTSAATFAVTKSSLPANVSSVAWDASNKVATLTLANNLTAGTYSIQVGGLGLASGSDTASVTAVDQAVSKINFLSSSLVESDTTHASIAYQVLNQYGEDVTTTAASGLTFTTSVGTIDASSSAGKLVVSSATAFTLGDKVSVTAIDGTTSTFASAVATVSNAAAVASVKVTGIYNANNSTPTAGDAGNGYYLLVSATDQYGSPVSTTALLNAGLLVNSSSPATADVARTAGAATFTTVTVNGTAQTAIALAGTLAAGTTNFTFISTTTGQNASYPLTVKAAAAVDSLSLSQPNLAVAGEKFNVPFTAVDQFGAAVTSATELGGVTLSTSDPSHASASFVHDYTTGQTNLVVDATGVTAKENLVVTGITPSGKVAQVSIPVQATAVPTVITGLTNVDTAVAGVASTPLATSNVVVQDQYGRTVSTLPAGYTITATSSNTAAVTVSASPLTTSTTLAGVAKGSSTITLTLANAGTAVANSSYTFNESDVNTTDVTSFNVDDVPTMFAGTGHTVALNVYGKLSNGTVVALPTTEYSVSTTNGLTYDTATGDLDASAVTVPTGSTSTAQVIVIFDGSNGTTVTKNVTVSGATPAVAKIATQAATGTGVEAVTVSNGVAYVSHSATTPIADVVGNFTYTDQYGATLSTAPATSVVITNLTTAAGTQTVTNNNTATPTFSAALAAGDTYTLTVITSNGVTSSVKVVVS